MEFFFPEDELTPATRATPEETRVTSLSAQPYPDGRRVRVNMEITPFQKRPHIEVILTDSSGHQIALTHFVEPMNWKMEFTLHVRVAERLNPYTLSARLSYPDGPSAALVNFPFEMPPAEELNAADSGLADSD